jgi:2-hydroxychromene-2-carboxylate isomerase
MADRIVNFYFAFNSPYSFLADSRIERELAPFNLELRAKPVYSPRTGGAPDPNSPKLRYLSEDVRRFADAYGLKLNPGPFADSRNACIGFLFAQDRGVGAAYRHAVFAARFLEAGNIGDQEVLAQVAEKCELKRGDFTAALQDRRYQDALDSCNKEAAADGAFGIPFFVIDGKKFWGNDRIEWLIRELQKA